MSVETVPNWDSPPAILLRKSYRDEAGKSQKRTLANLSKLPASLIAGLKGLLKGGTVIGAGDDGLSIERSLPRGHVAATLGTLRKLALDQLILGTAKDEGSRRHRDLVVGLIVDRLVSPRSKLGFVRSVNGESADSSLGEVLSLGKVAEREVYGALDWLANQQQRIENGLARRHLKDGTLVLYDVSSSYFEGRKCPLAHHGYSRDHRPDRLQIVYGLLCTREGLPVAVEVFDGNTADPATLTDQVAKLKQRFALDRVVLVGDRGMLTSARVREDDRPAGFDWISCLRSGAIQELAAEQGPLQLSLFDERDLAEIEAPEQFPGERLIVCRNPLLATERASKREPLRGQAEIGLKLGALLDQHKMAKHFEIEIEIEIGEAHLAWRRNVGSIEREAWLDGIYVVRTSLPAEVVSAGETVQAYKDLARVKRAFRSLKTTDLDIRPIRHWTAERVRAHVFLCMLAYHVEWHLRQALAPLLFHYTEIEASRAARSSPVTKAEPSPQVQAKKATKRNSTGLTVMAFGDLMAHLGTLARNTVAAGLQKGHTFIFCTRPTAIQEAAFKLLDLDPARIQ
jgi:hypothetical protein